MKHNSSLLLAGAAAVWFSGAALVQAQNFTITLTALEQRASKDNGTNTIIPPPTVVVLNNAAIMKQLAVDEHAAGHWGSNSFPRGTIFFYSGQFGIDYEGYNLGVSDILTLQLGTNLVTWGSSQDGTFNSSHVSRQLVTLAYDSTAYGGRMKFSVSGMGFSKDATTNVKGPVTFPVGATGVWNESSSMTAQLAGEGVDAQGNGMILTGSIVLGGSGLQYSGPPLLGTTNPPQPAP